MSDKHEGGRELLLIRPQIAQAAPLFPPLEAHLLSQEMYDCFMEFISDIKNVEEYARILSYNLKDNSAFLNIANEYIFYKEFYDKNIYLEMRAEVKEVQASGRKLAKVLQKLPKNARFMLDESMRRYAAPKQTVRIDTLLTMLNELEEACAPVAGLKAKRRGRPSLSYACGRLWTLWEEITGRPFVRSWEEAPGRRKVGGGRDGKEFTNLDAQFVLSIMTALEPTISLAQVRDALKSVAKSRLRIEGEAAAKAK